MISSDAEVLNIVRLVLEVMERARRREEHIALEVRRGGAHSSGHSHYIHYY